LADKQFEIVSFHIPEKQSSKRYNQAYVDPDQVEVLVKMNDSIKGLEETYRRAIQKPEVLARYEYSQLLREDYLARISEFRQAGREEGREEGREALLKELYLNDSVSSDAVLDMLCRIHPLPRAEELLQEWTKDKQH